MKNVIMEVVERGFCIGCGVLVNDNYASPLGDFLLAKTLCRFFPGGSAEVSPDSLS